MSNINSVPWSALWRNVFIRIVDDRTDVVCAVLIESDDVGEFVAVAVLLNRAESTDCVQS